MDWETDALDAYYADEEPWEHPQAPLSAYEIKRNANISALDAEARARNLLPATAAVHHMGSEDAESDGGSPLYVGTESESEFDSENSAW